MTLYPELIPMRRAATCRQVWAIQVFKPKMLPARRASHAFRRARRTRSGRPTML